MNTKKPENVITFPNIRRMKERIEFRKRMTTRKRKRSTVYIDADVSEVVKKYLAEENMTFSDLAESVLLKRLQEKGWVP